MIEMYELLRKTRCSKSVDFIKSIARFADVLKKRSNTDTTNNRVDEQVAVRE